MLVPIILPQYSSHSTTEKVIEVDKHVDTVIVRKDVFDKYEKFYKELSNFDNTSKYEFIFEQKNPGIGYGGSVYFRINHYDDDQQLFLEKLNEACEEATENMVNNQKYVEEHRSNLGRSLKKSKIKLDYIESKWWFKLFFNKKDFEYFELNEIIK